MTKRTKPASPTKGIGRPSDKRASHALPRFTLETAWEAELADDQLDNKQVAHPQPNALAAFAMPQMDLIGPTVADDIRRAIARSGADAVKELGRAHVCTPVPTAHLVCLLLLSQ